MTYQSDASTELNSGSVAASGKKFGSMPCDTAPDHSSRMPSASASRPVDRHSPRRAMNVSRPQSVNHGYPATIVRPEPRRTMYASAARCEPVAERDAPPALGRAQDRERRLRPAHPQNGLVPPGRGNPDRLAGGEIEAEGPG